jgi:site-specific DNA recombinase
MKTHVKTAQHPRRCRCCPAPSESAEPVLRVFLYRRVNQDPDEVHQPYSLDAELQALWACIPSHPGWVEAGDYLERATAEYLKGRPQLQLLLRDTASGKFDLVLVASFDRWSRNLADLLNTVTCLSDHTVAFRAATEHFHPTNRVGKMTP